MARIQYSEKLRDLFRKSQEQLRFDFIPDHNSVKHWIEFFHVPHTEVGGVFVDGRSVDFSYKPQPADEIFVEALLGPVDVTKPTNLRALPYPAYRFIVDECVKNLAAKLRMIGCDVVSESRFNDRQIVEISAVEKRVILTRDRGLLKRKDAVWGRLIRNTDSEEQFKEVIHFFGLSQLPQALTTCLVCNGKITSVRKDEVLHLIGPKTRLYYDEFSRCDQCGKIYWEGSHYTKMKENLKELFPKTS